MNVGDRAKIIATNGIVARRHGQIGTIKQIERKTLYPIGIEMWDGVVWVTPSEIEILYQLEAPMFDLEDMELAEMIINDLKEENTP